MKTTRSGRYSQMRFEEPGNLTLEVMPRHTLTLDRIIEVDGVIIHQGGTLVFDPKLYIGVHVLGNFIVNGRLVMKPYGISAHYIEFQGIYESQFEGGAACHVIPSDTGLWVMGGELDIVGSPDMRNVHIQGTPSGRSHIAIMQGSHRIGNCNIRYMGPRKNGAKVLGRYGLHFHHCGESSRGSIVKNVMVIDCGSHAFVPHASHGITFEDCTAFNVNESAYWWDEPKSITDRSNDSNDIKWHRCTAETLIPIPAQRGYDLAGFVLGSGTGNECIDCTVIDHRGRGSSGCFRWPEDSNQSPNKWVFRGARIK